MLTIKSIIHLCKSILINCTAEKSTLLITRRQNGLKWNKILYSDTWSDYFFPIEVNTSTKKNAQFKKPVSVCACVRCGALELFVKMDDLLNNINTGSDSIKLFSSWLCESDDWWVKM